MSWMNKTMAWLGLVDENEPMGDPSGGSLSSDGGSVLTGQRLPSQRPQVRPVSPSGGSPPLGSGGPRLVGSAPGYRRPSGVTPDLSVVVRPGDSAGATVGYTETIEVNGFDEAKKIADLMRERIPVIVNLRNTEPALVRRLVDFSSGLVYALDGSIRKVSEGVLLVSPPRVKILERELRRLSDLGLYDVDS